MPEHIVASVHGELRRVTTSAQDAWTRARAFLHGLGIAWVSAASVLLALVLFAIAPPAQDLFLEVRGSREIGFEFWLGSYTLIVLAWVLPVYISARWILCNARRQDVLPAHTRAVEDWVARAVPRVLALTCLLAVLIGQVMALSNAPTLTDPTLASRTQQLTAQLHSECGVSEAIEAFPCAFENIDRLARWAELFAIQFSKGVGAEEITIYWLYALTFGPVLLLAAPLLWRAMYGGGRYWRALLIAYALFALAVWCLVVGSILTDSNLLAPLIYWLGLPVDALDPLLYISLFAGWSLLLFFVGRIPWKWVRIPLKVLWWLVTLPIVIGVLGMGAVLDYGFISYQLGRELGLGHVALLPLITLVLAYGVWKVFRAPATESVSGASAWPGGAPEGVRTVFVVVLGISGLLLAVQPFLSPVTVTDYVYRGLVAPILLGVLVPAGTLLSFLSLRLRLPIVALLIAFFVGTIVVRSRLNDVRPMDRSAPRFTLEQSVDRWSMINKCDWRVDPKKCPPAIIVAAAGGASRAAFLTATVIGQLIDDEKKAELRPFRDQLFAISAVSGGALGGVVTYAALADSQIPGRTKNGLGEPPCLKDAPDTEWFLSGPAWVSWWPGSKMAPVQPQDPSGIDHEIPVEPDKSWRQCLQRIVAGDFLSPVFVSLISNDLLGFSLLGDRAAVLEDAWEQRYARQSGQDYKSKASTLQKSLVDLRDRVLDDEKNWLPVLLLNGTSVTTGRRIITSDIDTLLARPPNEKAGSSSKSRLFRDAYDLHELLEARREFTTARLRPDGSQLLTVVADTVLVWDTKSGDELWSTADAKSVDGGAADGAVADGKGGDATGPAFRALKEIAVKAKEIAGNATEDRVIKRIELSHDGKLLLIIDKGGRVSVWDLDKHSFLWSELIQTNLDAVVRFSPDGDLVLTPSSDGHLLVRNARTNKVLHVSLPAPPNTTIEAAAFTRTGIRVLTVNQEKDGLRQVWNPTGDSWGKPVDLNAFKGGDAVFSADGTQILTLSQAGIAEFWNADTGFKGPSIGVPADYEKYDFTPDGRKALVLAPRELVIASTDGKQYLSGPSDSEKGLQSATLSSDGKRLLLVEGISAELWDLEPVRKLRSFKGEEGWVQGAVFGADDSQDSQVVTWSDNGVAIVWDANTGEPKQIFSISRSSMALCGKCDIRLSTAATMSARFPVISPHGNIYHADGQHADRVVDGGYFENFGATTALELATVLSEPPYELEPAIILINNEPATSGMNCISDDTRLESPAPPRTIAFPIIESPIYTMLETRSARGSHAAVELCSSPLIGKQKFAYVTVARDERKASKEPDERSAGGKELSMSWWLSKYVQKRLDEQVGYGDESDREGRVVRTPANDASFATINGWRAH